jgi:CheY-like chemotaxis protein
MDNESKPAPQVPNTAVPDGCPEHGPASGAPSVLVVDDNRDAADSMAALIALLFKLPEQRVHVAYDGLQGWAMAQRVQPRLLLLDIGMPGMTGYELAAAVRKQGWSARATLVAVTGWNTPKDIARAMDAGFDHHLVKPVSASQIRAILPELI